MRRFRLVVGDKPGRGASVGREQCLSTYVAIWRLENGGQGLKTGADRWFTVILVPDSERSVLRLRFPMLVLQVLTAVTVVVVFTGVAIFGSYMSLLDDRLELQQLRQINRWQRDRLVELEDQQIALHEALAQVEELDGQLREMLNMAPGNAVLGDTDEMRPVAEWDGEHWTGARTVIAAGPPTDPAAIDLARLQVQAEMLAGTLANQEESLKEIRSAIAAEQAALAATPTIWPVSNGIITSGFGYRRSPLGVGYEFHRGIDLAAPRGTPVMATAEGVVTFIGWRSSYGITITLDHGNGTGTLYAHLGKSSVDVGDRVTKGQIIGLLGSTGRSTGPHVHYEVHINGQAVNPRSYMQTRTP